MKKMLILIMILVLFLTACQVPLPAQTTAAQTVPETTAPEVTVQETTAPVTTVPETTLSETTVPETTQAPTEPEFDPLALARSLTLEQRVGQLFLARCPEVSALEELQTYCLGGYLLFGRDFDGQTPESLSQTIAAYQAAAAVPMLIAVDEEGGTVARVSGNSAFRDSRFKSPRRLYEAGGLELIRKTEEEKCVLLKSLGINVNLAPVCDITTDPNAFMYGRSIGLGPEQTGEFVCAVIEEMAAHQIGGVLKHFPGYGNNTDTHVGIAEDSRSLEELENGDLVPFAMGIRHGCDAIMVSHTVIQCLDPAQPATLSAEVIVYLRQTMGFSGVIMTDDLAMGAITERYGAEEAAVLAVLAGNDLLCSSEYAAQYTAVLEAVRSGRIPETQVEQAAARVLQWKYDLGLLEN